MAAPTGWQGSFPCAGVELASNRVLCRCPARAAAAPIPQPHPKKTPKNSNYNAINLICPSPCPCGPALCVPGIPGVASGSSLKAPAAASPPSARQSHRAILVRQPQLLPHGPCAPRRAQQEQRTHRSLPAFGTFEIQSHGTERGKTTPGAWGLHGLLLCPECRCQSCSSISGSVNVWLCPQGWHRGNASGAGYPWLTR